MASPAAAANAGANANANADASKTNSRTVADTITGEHEHTICGYSLLKGIGDGEPVASERFTVGGHEWVLLFYPDGKKSSNSDHANQMYPRVQAAAANFQLLGPRDGNGQNPPAERDARGEGQQAAAAAAAAAAADYQPGQGDAPMDPDAPPGAAPAADAPAAGGDAAPADNQAAGHAAAVAAAANAAAANAAGLFPVPPLNFHVHVPPPPGMQNANAQQRGGRRSEAANEYCALFVALIGEGKDPQGVMNTTDGKVVRAFHRFTLVDQKAGRDIMKGRERKDSAVKISCARQDPNARNCHGYRKFVKKSVLEDPDRGFLVEDRIIIRYTIELVVSQGGALMAQKPPAQKTIEVPAPTIGVDFAQLLHNDENADITFRVVPEAAVEGSVDQADSSMIEGEQCVKAHRLVLQARSPVFKSMLESGMMEGETGEVSITDMNPDVFRALLHFIYSDDLPEELQEGRMTTAMAQHLLLAADRYQLIRLRTMCEKRLCDSVDVETVATTLMLADKSNADNLRKVCLNFVANNLSQVICTEEYKRLTESCGGMVNEILAAVAVQGQTATRPAPAGRTAPGPRLRARRRDEEHHAQRQIE